MSGPPKDTPPAELWLKLTERPRPTCEFQFPGPGVNGEPLPKAKIVILYEAELHACRANATKVARELVGDAGRLGDLGYEEIYRNEMASQMVALCLRAHDNPTFFVFPSPKSVRQKLTTDEVAAVASAYTQFRIESGPMVSELSPAELDAWFKVSMEGASRVPFSVLSGEALIDYVMYLVSKIKSLSIATGSPGSAPSEQSPPAGEQVDDSERLALE
jgi:hypothetical protein